MASVIDYATPPPGRRRAWTAAIILAIVLATAIGATITFSSLAHRAAVREHRRALLMQQQMLQATMQKEALARTQPAAARDQ